MVADKNRRLSFQVGVVGQMSGKRSGQRSG